MSTNDKDIKYFTEFTIEAFYFILKNSSNFITNCKNANISIYDFVSYFIGISYIINNPEKSEDVYTKVCENITNKFIALQYHVDLSEEDVVFLKNNLTNLIHVGAGPKKHGSRKRIPRKRGGDERVSEFINSIRLRIWNVKKFFHSNKIIPVNTPTMIPTLPPTEYVSPIYLCRVSLPYPDLPIPKIIKSSNDTRPPNIETMKNEFYDLYSNVKIDKDMSNIDDRVKSFAENLVDYYEKAFERIKNEHIEYKFKRIIEITDKFCLHIKNVEFKDINTLIDRVEEYNSKEPYKYLLLSPEIFNTHLHNTYDYSKANVAVKDSGVGLGQPSIDRYKDEYVESMKNALHTNWLYDFIKMYNESLKSLSNENISMINLFKTLHESIHMRFQIDIHDMVHSFILAYNSISKIQDREANNYPPALRFVVQTYMPLVLEHDSGVIEFKKEFSIYLNRYLIGLGSYRGIDVMNLIYSYFDDKSFINPIEIIPKIVGNADELVRTISNTSTFNDSDSDGSRSSNANEARSSMDSLASYATDDIPYHKIRYGISEILTILIRKCETYWLYNWDDAIIQVNNLNTNQHYLDTNSLHDIVYGHIYLKARLCDGSSDGSSMVGKGGKGGQVRKYIVIPYLCNDNRHRKAFRIKGNGNLIFVMYKGVATEANKIQKKVKKVKKVKNK